MKNHLPLLGAGPAYAGTIALATAVALILDHQNMIKPGNVPELCAFFYFTGGVFLASGIFLWAMANFQCRISENIQKNVLVTTGIYGYVRNPILSGHLLANTGLLLFSCNLFLLTLPFIYWIYMTVLLRMTEEKWLRDLYGQIYVEYCRRVNRCIPFPGKKFLF